MGTRRGSTAELDVVSALLRAMRNLDRLSVVLLLCAGLGLVFTAARIGECALGGRALLLASVVCGLIEAYFAFRVRLDERLLVLLAAGFIDLAGLDRGLARIGTRVPAGATHEPPQRLPGVLMLARRQAFALAAQILLLVLYFVGTFVC